MAAIFISIAFLALAAGFCILHSGRRSSHSEVPADHKVKIRKALSPALQEVNDEPPAGLSSLESAALAQEEQDPIDIFLDFDLPMECRLEAQDRLRDAGFSFTSPIHTESVPSDIDQNKNECDVDVHDTATDEDLEPPFELTGE
jgi:hypothetical protein